MNNLSKSSLMNEKFAKHQISQKEQSKIKGGLIGFTCEEKRGYNARGEEITYEAMYFNVLFFRLRVR